MHEQTGATRARAGVVAPTVLRDVAEAEAALLRVIRVAATSGPPEAVFTAVTDEASAYLRGALMSLARYERSGKEQIILAHTGDHLTDGEWFPGANPNTISARMWKSHRPERIDDFASVPGPKPRFDRRGVRACVAVPVFVGGELWGCLSSTSRTGPLARGTEDRLNLFAEVLAPAIEIAAARVAMRVLADEQAALLRVAALVARGAPEAALFDAVTVEAADLIEDEPTTLVRYEGHRTFTVLATRGGPAGPGTRVRVPADDAGTLAEIMRTHRPARQDRYDTIAEHSYSHRQYDVGSSVSVPIVVHGRLWGALGVLNEGRWLPTETEGRLVKFSELVGSALANAQARAELEGVGRQQAALRRVAELIARGSPLDEVLDAVASEASRILAGTPMALFRYEPDGSAVVVAQANGPATPGLRIPGAEAGVRRTGRSVRFARLAGSAYAQLGRDFGVEAMVAVPILVEGRVWGGLAATADEPLPVGTEESLAEYAELAAAALANAENRAQLRASRARLVQTADDTRRRLQRDVHDGAQQRLVQTVLTLKLGLELAARGKDPVELMREALLHAERATVELRDLVHGILPASLSRDGLRPGLESLIAGLTVPVDLDVAGLPHDRLPGEVEVTAYFIVAEAVTNVVKHADAGRVGVRVAVAGGVVDVEVVDDGRGGADPHGAGLTGLTDRVDALNGRLELVSPPGEGTVLRVRLPTGR